MLEASARAFVHAMNVIEQAREVEKKRKGTSASAPAAELESHERRGV